MVSIQYANCPRDKIYPDDTISDLFLPSETRDVSETILPAILPLFFFYENYRLRPLISHIHHCLEDLKDKINNAFY